MENNNYFAIYETELGLIKIEYEDNTITSILKTKSQFKGYPTEFTDMVYRELKDYINKRRKSFDFNYQLIGTEFQKKVWTELLKIPYGETRSYKEVAINIGNSKAARAVGMACNKNPIIVMVPCHRVIGSNGGLTGYAGGLSMKQDLLDIEQNSI
ncbi:MAG: methylated-DNA--[protein]-cysteine S-methyltransferase [Bacilli bacterium]